MPNQLQALIKYLEERDGASMVSLEEGFIMVKKTKNNCIHKDTGYTKNCNSGVNCTCEKWELK